MTQERDTAKKLVEVLDYGTGRIDHATASRLAQAREQALDAALAHAHAPQTQSLLSGAGRYIHDHMHGHKRWTSALMIVTIALLVFIILQQNSTNTPVETDTLLLASELPPEAYVDQGFHAWLENSSVL